MPVLSIRNWDHDITDKRSYRPISILSAIAKVFEKIKYEQLYTKFSYILSSNMSGFPQGHSSCSALVKLTDWRVSLNSKKEAGVIPMDLSNAFDSIYRNLLLAKLKPYGLRESAIELVHSYLSERKLRVKCNSIYSDWLPVHCGVPQGSPLGLLLFNIFISDINDINAIIGNISIFRLYTLRYNERSLWWVSRFSRLHAEPRRSSLGFVFFENFLQLCQRVQNASYNLGVRPAHDFYLNNNRTEPKDT